MKKTLIASIAALFLAAPAMAQSLDTLLPTLTWPDDGVTVSTKGCETKPGVCAPAN
ncbi:hypothetical protein MASR1M32_11660 [Rhodobacter sp.]